MSPILIFRKNCTDSGIHALSHLAVLDCIESGKSCRKVGEMLDMPYSSVWQATVALEQQGLVELTDTPSKGRYAKRLILTLSDAGRELLAVINASLTPPSPTSPDR